MPGGSGRVNSDGLLVGSVSSARVAALPGASAVAANLVVPWKERLAEPTFPLSLLRSVSKSLHQALRVALAGG